MMPGRPFRHVRTPIGGLTVEMNSSGVKRIRFGLVGRPAEQSDHPWLLRTEESLHRYFGGSPMAFDLPVDVRGTPFFRDILKVMRRIPHGTTWTYKDLAEAAGHPKAWRAAGTACKNNPLPIVIPCHRVIRSDGSLGRYSGKPSVKRWLIDFEQRKSVSR